MQHKIYISFICIIVCYFSFVDNEEKIERRFIFERIGETRFDPNYVIIKEYLTNTRNRAPDFNLEFSIKRNMGMATDVFVHVSFYKFADNLYKPTALKADLNICEGLKLLKLDKEFISCPLNKGNFSIKNFNLNNFPMNYIPNWKFKIIINAQKGEKFLFSLTNYVNVENV